MRKERKKTHNCEGRKTLIGKKRYHGASTKPTELPEKKDWTGTEKLGRSKINERGNQRRPRKSGIRLQQERAQDDHGTAGASTVKAHRKNRSTSAGRKASLE